MSHNSQIERELQELSPLLSQKVLFKVPYEVPRGYFEELPARIFQSANLKNERIAELEELGSFLATMDNSSLYSVPTDYFSELPVAIQSGAAALDEVRHTLEQDLVLPANSEKTTPYQIPPGYFEENHIRILQAVRNEPDTKVIRIGFQTKWLRVAVAAMLTGIFISVAWFWQQSPLPMQGEMSVSTPAIPSSISESEMEHFLDMAAGNESALSTFTDASSDWDNKDLHAMLADVSETELEQYIGKSVLENEF
jgi:hypothetical protein